MELPLSLVLPLLGILVLALAITGPGLWSEEWGWWWVRRGQERDRRRDR
jgi:hypothetical protein